MQKLAKLMQNGVATIVPDNRYWNQFVNNHNRAISNSRNAEQEYITIVPLSDQEQKAATSNKKKERAIPVAPNLQSENQALKNELSELKSMMLKYMAEQKEQENIDSEDQPEQKRRGRPAKTV